MVTTKVKVESKIKGSFARQKKGNVQGDIGGRVWSKMYMQTIKGKMQSKERGANQH